MPQQNNPLSGAPLNPLTSLPPEQGQAPAVNALTGGSTAVPFNALSSGEQDKSLGRRIKRVEETLGAAVDQFRGPEALLNTAISAASAASEAGLGAIYAARHPEIMPGTPGAIERAFRAGRAELAGATPVGRAMFPQYAEGQLDIQGNEFLEDLGVPALGHVSTLLPFLFNETGEGWRLKKGGMADIRGRDIAGVVPEALADPLTFYSAGLKPAAGVVREGGRAVGVVPSLTAAGRKAAARAVEEETPEAARYAQYLASKLPPERAARKIEVDMATKEIAREAALAKIHQRVEAGATNLVDTSTLRFAGAPLSKAAPLTAALNTNWGAKAMRSTPVRLLDAAFNETLAPGRRLPGMEEAKSALRTDRRVLASRVAKELQPALGRWTKRRLDRPFNFHGQQVRTMGEYAVLHIDDPARFPAEILSEDARKGVDHLRRTMPEWFAAEVDDGAIPAEVWRENYIPHQFRNNAHEMRDLSTKWTDVYGSHFDPSFNTGPHGEARVFPTLTDAMEFAKKLQGEGVIKWQLKPNLDIRTVLANRGATHAETRAAARFERRMIANYGLGEAEVADEVFRRMKPEVVQMMDDEVRQLDVDAEAGQVATGLSRPGVQRYASRAEVGAAIANAWQGKPARGGVVRRMGPVAKAAYYQARIGASKNMDELLKFLKKAETEVGDVSPDALNAVREAHNTGYRQHLSAFGEPYKRVEQGPLAGYYLPQSAADEVAREGSRIKELAEVKGLLRLKDAIDDAFKFGVTIPFPAFTFRNVVSDNAEVMLDLGLAAANPRTLVETGAIAAGRDGTLHTPLGRVPFEEARTMFKELGLETPSGSIHDFIGAQRPTSRVTTNAVSSFFRKIYRTEQIQDLSKMQLFVTYLKRGLSPPAAAERVHSTVFDYTKLTKFERQWLRRLWPIQYTWASKNIRKVADTLVRNPGRVSAMLRLGDADTGPEADALPSYIRGDFKIKMESDGKTVYLRGLDLPVSSSIETALGSEGRDAILTNLAGLAPTIRTILEYGTKHELYTGKDIREPFVVRNIAADVVQRLPAPIQEWLEWNPENSSVNGTKFYLLVKATPLSRLVSSAQRFDTSDKTLAAIQFLTGFGYEEFELDEAQEKALQNNVRSAELEAQRKGKYHTILVPNAQPQSDNPLSQ
jgi:hypothetical protein